MKKLLCVLLPLLLLTACGGKTEVVPGETVIKGSEDLSQLNQTVESTPDSHEIVESEPAGEVITKDELLSLIRSNTNENAVVVDASAVRHVGVEEFGQYSTRYLPVPTIKSFSCTRPDLFDLKSVEISVRDSGDWGFRVEGTCLIDCGYEVVIGSEGESINGVAIPVFDKWGYDEALGYLMNYQETDFDRASVDVYAANILGIDKGIQTLTYHMVASSHDNDWNDVFEDCFDIVIELECDSPATVQLSDNWVSIGSLDGWDMWLVAIDQYNKDGGDHTTNYIYARRQDGQPMGFTMLDRACIPMEAYGDGSVDYPAEVFRETLLNDVWTFYPANGQFDNYQYNMTYFTDETELLFPITTDTSEGYYTSTEMGGPGVNYLVLRFCVPTKEERTLEEVQCLDVIVEWPEELWEVPEKVTFPPEA